MWKREKEEEEEADEEKEEEEKSEKNWGPRRNGWAGAVSGGQGQYRLFHYQKSDFRHIEKAL